MFHFILALLKQEKIAELPKDLPILQEVVNGKT
jgi:hypothetical protein